MKILSNNNFISLEVKASKSKADIYLDKLLAVLNEGRAEKKLELITYPRLNKMLQKFGKSKKNWDRDLFIGSVMDRKNASAYFWYLTKNNG